MAQTIKLKRSATQGAVPTTAQLDLGEVAINTYDGKMYIKKDVSGTESIVEIGSTDFSGAIITRGITTFVYTATSSQTTFSGADDNSATLAYTTNQIQVYLNGVMLDASDYTATNGTSIVLSSGAAADDILTVVAYYSDDIETIGDLDVTGTLTAGGNEFPTTQGALGEVLTADGSGLVEWKLPQTLSYQVYNADSTTIAAGEPVYVFGSNGANISVKRAFNTSEATSAQTLGLANESIAVGATGVVIAQGLLRGVDTSGYTAGQAIYLGATAGTVTTTKPHAPNHLVYLGFIQTATNNGRIFVRTQNGYELDELHDVQITSTPSNKQVLGYNTSTNLWNPITVWHDANDGAGSGLDADLWDGNQFASYLNQAVLTTSSPTFSLVKAKSYHSPVQALGSVSGTTDVSLANGDTATATIAGTTTFTFSGLQSGYVNTLTLVLTNPGAYTITWPASVVFNRGAAPILPTSGKTVLVFETYDNGTSWSGIQVWRSND
jgi:hypothetical protein